MIAAVIAVTGYSATDAEIKSLLDQKKYVEVATHISASQITNMLDTTTAREISRQAALSNAQYWKLYRMCEVHGVSIPETIEYYKSVKSLNAYMFAKIYKNEAIELETLKWVLDELPDVKCENIGIGLVTNDTQYFIKAAERIYRDSKNRYSIILQPRNVTDDIKVYVTDAVANKLDSECFKTGYMFTRLIDWCAKNNSKVYLSRKYFYPDLMSTWTNNLDKVKKLSKHVEYVNDAFELIAKNVADPKEAYTFSTTVDKRRKNKEMTKRLYPVISKDIHLAVQTALYLNDVDKMIDIMLNAGEDLTAAEISSMLPSINSLTADYRAVEIVTALRNVNSRYTLRLYNEREVWEPVLSKVRAMIDVRQM